MNHWLDVRLQEFHFSLYAHKSQLFCRTISIVKEKFLPRLNIPLCKDPNPVVTIDHQDFGTTIRVDGVVGEADFIP